MGGNHRAAAATPAALRYQKTPRGRRRFARSSADAADESNLEPLDVPPQWGWSDEIESPPEDWWRGLGDSEWQAPELPLDDGQVLVLDADDPFPADDWPVYRTD